MKARVEPFNEECCGFLFGTDDNAGRTICDLMPVPNVSSVDRRRNFAISASSYLAAEALAESKGLQLAGVYHSHPESPAVPSVRDLAAAQPFFSYVILSVYSGETTAVRSWRLAPNRQFEEESLSII